MPARGKRSLEQRSGTQNIWSFQKSPGLSPLLKSWINIKREVLGEENNRNCVVMSCTNNLTYRCLLSAVNLWRSFQKKKKRERKKISVTQDAINFFTPQLILSVFRVSLANGKMDSHLAYFIIQLKFLCCNFSKPINRC